MAVKVRKLNAVGQNDGADEYPDARDIKVVDGVLLVGNVSGGDFETVAIFQAKYWMSAYVV